ncbi:hypothetical protein GCM10027590_08430 [Nocardiopsis nanhaiensis]
MEPGAVVELKGVSLSGPERGPVGQAVWRWGAAWVCTFGTTVGIAPGPGVTCDESIPHCVVQEFRCNAPGGVNAYWAETLTGAVTV